MTIVTGKFAVACNRTTIRRLPPVLLYTQVTRMLNGNREEERDVEGGSFNGISRQPQRKVPQGPYRCEKEAGAKSAHSGLQTGKDVPPPPYLLAQRTAGEDGEGQENRGAN